MNISRKAWWLIIISLIYVDATLIDIYIMDGVDSKHIRVMSDLWMFALSLPLWIPPLKKVIFHS